MAWELPCFKSTFIAGADLTANQFHYVKLNANNQVILCAAATDTSIGILQNTPASGEGAEVMMLGVSKVRVGAGGAIAAGNLVGTDASGHCDPKTPGVDTTEYGTGYCVEGAGVNAIGTVTINGLNPLRCA
jgi:hypothetical protein